MFSRFAISSRKSFTLIELLIVIGIVSILAVVVILVLNPAELLKQGRDSARISDLASINKSLNLFQTDGGSSLGTASTTYVSIPDPTATSTTLGNQCQGLGLPSLPSGYTYHCSASSTYRNVDATGWIPVNLSSLSFGSSLGILPIDPVNTTSSNLYYTYTTGGSWEMTALMESTRYEAGGSADKMTTDGGDDPIRYEIGTNLRLNPTGVKLWFDASQIALSDGDSIVTWPDRSGNGSDLTQATASKRPLFKTNIVNGRPVVRFDGTDDFLGTTPETISFPAPTTVFFVAKISALTAASQAMFHNWAETGAEQTAGAEASGGRWWLFGGTFAAGGTINTAWHIHGANFHTTQSERLVDGVVVATSGASTLKLRGVVIGTRYGGTTEPFVGDMAEALVYIHALSTSERQRVERYLSGKWNVAL